MGMWIYGLFGLIAGFIFGMLANGYLLRDVSREELRRNKKLRIRYGLLNWGIAFLGMAMAIGIARHYSQT